MNASPEPAFDAAHILQRNSALLEEYLGQILSRYSSGPPRLIEAIEYSLLAGGKRLRPALVLESFETCFANAAHQPRRREDAKEDAKQNRNKDSTESFAAVFVSSRLRGSSERSALASAAAVELIHTFSLIHDDLPAMDDDDLRRGKPTNHRVFGEAMAILAGDAMVTMAFEVLSGDAEAQKVPALVAELAAAAGPAGMIGGQVLDIAGEHRSLDLAELQQLHRMKTGALLRAACRMGAIAAGAGEAQLAALTAFGTHLGLAFQIVDDLLDVTASSDQLGKTAGKDTRHGKNTYPALLGLDATRREAAAQLQAALAALTPLGDTAESLRRLAHFVIKRQA